MRLLPNGRVYVEKGETMPVICPCGALVCVPEGSEWSECPACGRENIHGLFDWVKVEEGLS